jgi:uncharacterized protein with HEPN domain
MIGFAEKVVAYASSFDQVGFVGSGANYDAALRNLELIGEAAIHVPGSIRAAHPRCGLSSRATYRRCRLNCARWRPSSNDRRPQEAACRA